MSDVPVVVADVPVVADRFSSGRVAVLAAGRRNVLAFENHVAAVLISGWKLILNEGSKMKLFKKSKLLLVKFN